MSQVLPYVIYASVIGFDSENPMKNIVCPKRNATPGNSVCDFNQDVMAVSIKNASDALLAITDPPFSVLISHEADPNRIKWTK